RRTTEGRAMSELPMHRRREHARREEQRLHKDLAAVMAEAQTLRRELLDELNWFNATNAEREHLTSDLARVTAERDEANTFVEALEAKVEALAPHGSCGCSSDSPTDLCLHHSPQVLHARREEERLHRELRTLTAERNEYKAGRDALSDSMVRSGKEWEARRHELTQERNEALAALDERDAMLQAAFDGDLRTLASGDRWAMDVLVSGELFTAHGDTALLAYRAACAAEAEAAGVAP
ncbi:MAG: hypothetical protein ABI665_28430, partial [Vicinamibacterales bacterium]